MMRRCFDSRRFASLALIFLALMVAAPWAQAHKASDAYLQIQRTADTLALRWDLALRDLDAVLDLDRNVDQRLTWGEVRTRLDNIKAYAVGALQLQQGSCTLAEAHPPAIEKRIDGMYLVLRMQARCHAEEALAIDYRLLRDIDPTHRGLLRIEGATGESPVLRSLDPSAGLVRVEWPGSAQAHSSAAFFKDGVHHILIGYDHVLFLLCLLLPAVMRRGARDWTPIATWQAAAWPMLGIVTMFTLAHSITLALAGLKILSLSPRIVEPAIAITIILAALDNLYPILRGRRKLFSFLFGLIHGFGFAGALGELDLPMREFVLALLQFNLGVEAGQLMVVAVALVALLALRHWHRYSPLILQGGSRLTIALASIWLCERLFDTKVLPFS